MEKIKFKRKNLVSCSDASIWEITFEYICWVLSGKPDKWGGNKWLRITGYVKNVEK